MEVIVAVLGVAILGVIVMMMVPSWRKTLFGWFSSAAKERNRVRDTYVEPIKDKAFDKANEAVDSVRDSIKDRLDGKN